VLQFYEIGGLECEALLMCVVARGGCGGGGGGSCNCGNRWTSSSL